MSSYIATPIEYAEELLSKRNYKKAGAYLEYQVDMFRGTERTFGGYALRWGISKSNSYSWVKDFKIAIKKHHSFWSEMNENHVKFEENLQNAQQNGKKNAETPTQTDFKECVQNAQQNAQQNALTIDLNNINNIVEFLNAKTGKRFKAKTASTKKFIIARLNENYTVKDFQKVIDIKTKQWQGTEQEKYLRPETLFGNKFDGYLNESPAEDESQHWSEKWK